MTTTGESQLRISLSSSRLLYSERPVVGFVYVCATFAVISCVSWYITSTWSRVGGIVTASLSAMVRIVSPYNHSSIVEVFQNSLTYVKGERSGADDHIR